MRSGGKAEEKLCKNKACALASKQRKKENMNLPEKIESPATLRDLLSKQKEQFALALPKHLNADRFVRVALTAFNKTPRLMECTTASVLSCLMDCAQLGLEPDNVLGRAYLIPYRNKEGGTQCTLQIGYKGLVDLAYRSGQVDSIDAFAVHMNDKFTLTLGLSPNIEHVPALTDPGSLKGVYAVASLKGSTKPKFVYMTKEEVESIRKRSRAGNDGPWATDYEEMAKKTAVKRLAKMLPISAEFNDAVSRDNDNEFEDRIQAAKPVFETPAQPTKLLEPEKSAEPAKPEPSDNDTTSEEGDKLRELCKKYDLPEKDTLWWLTEGGFIESSLDQIRPKQLASIMKAPEKWVKTVKQSVKGVEAAAAKEGK